MNIDNGLVNGVVFVDLKKAFDTIDHNNIVMKKLRNYGVDSKILDGHIFSHSICVEASSTPLTAVNWIHT